MTVKLNTLHKAKLPHQEEHLTFVRIMQPESADQSTFIGRNRTLSINQGLASDQPDIDCRHCHALIAPHAYEQHLRDQHHDFNAPLQCIKCEQEFWIADAVKYARHIGYCQMHACEHPGCEKAFGSG